MHPLLPVVGSGRLSRRVPRDAGRASYAAGVAAGTVAGGTDVDALTVAGRRGRAAATLLVGALLLGGTLFGQDDDFPFGPFRMYSTRDDPDGQVRSTRVEAVDSSGRVLVVPDRATGLRRAEVEGQVDRFVADPSLLAEVSRAHDRLHPDEPSYEVVRVVVSLTQLRDSRPVGEPVDEVLVSWSRG